MVSALEELSAKRIYLCYAVENKPTHHSNHIFNLRHRSAPAAREKKIKMFVSSINFKLS